jgi:hypothetical protein
MKKDINACSSFLCSISSAPRGRRRRNSCGHRRSAPCGCRRRNPHGRWRWIPCGRRPMRSPQMVPTRSLEMDPMRSPKTGTRTAAAARRARRQEPGPPRKALRKRLRAFPTQAVRKNYKVSTRPPATFPLSPRVSKCPFSLLPLNAQLTSSGVLVAVFRVCGNGDNGVC